MSSVYSFLSVVAGIVGPGLVANLGNGAAVAEEGIEIDPTGDIGGLTIGADGAGMHALYADKSGTILVHLLRNSPMNQVLSAAYAFQTANATSHGQNTITLVDKNRGDVITCQQVGFKKAPPLGYGKEGKMVTWEFHAVVIERALGT